MTTDKPLTPEGKRQLEAGVRLDDLGLTTAPCTVTIGGKNQFTIVLREGKNRQIRRMCRVLGLRVKRLVRVREAGVRLGDLPVGKFRKIDQME